MAKEKAMWSSYQKEKEESKMQKSKARCKGAEQDAEEQSAMRKSRARGERAGQEAREQGKR